MERHKESRLSKRGVRLRLPSRSLATGELSRLKCDQLTGQIYTLFVPAAVLGYPFCSWLNQTSQGKGRVYRARRELSSIQPVSSKVLTKYELTFEPPASKPTLPSKSNFWPLRAAEKVIEDDPSWGGGGGGGAKAASLAMKLGGMTNVNLG